MMSNNKILTVSYGTFSCTLEGFDDAFGTMKAIAEYFRDLAAQDRYFGAEPPQPDAQMLALVAQQESTRRVEARDDEGTIVLSEVDGPALAPLGALAGAAAAASLVDGEEDDAEAEDAMDLVEALEAKDVALDDDDFDTEAVSDEALDDEAEVDDFEDEPVDAEDAAELAVADELIGEDEDADVDDADDADVLVEAPVEIDQADAEPVVKLTRKQKKEARDAKAKAKRKEKRRLKKEMKAAALLAEIDDAQDESLTAPANVASESDEAEATNEIVQDPPETDIVPSLPDAEVEAFFADSPVLAPDTSVDADLAPNDTTKPAKNESIADKLKRIRAVVSQHHGDDKTADYENENAVETDTDARAFAEEKQDTLVSDTLRDIQEAFDVDDQNEQASAAEPQYVVPAPKASEPDEDEPARPPRARVMKVKKADLEKAIQSGQLEEYDGGAPVKSSLNEDDEAELRQELDHLSAELHEANPEPKRKNRSNFDDQAEADLSRLMDKAKSQMDEPESATRRDAFTHLRAAVASKKADDAIGNDDDEMHGDDAYRADLANAVQGAGAADPAPLKLVAEQRVDVEEVSPVQPRRVAVEEKSAEPMIEGSFSDFASEMGATKLPDLLEAAASYMAHVEGQTQFSRPQLMTKVRQVERDKFSREDGLRSFGKLLRDGKIEKIKGGRFQVSDDIGYKPDAREAS